MLRRLAAISAFARRAPALVASTTTISPHLASPARAFNPHVLTPDEIGASARLKDITPIVGQPKPCAREGDWVLAYNLTDKLSRVTRDLLARAKWSEAEIAREVENLNAAKNAQIKQMRDRRLSWETIEDFQRTPWYRRFRPNDDNSVPFVSFECMKILEFNLIPPSCRGDPYSHLRKRHYEDTFHNEKYSEGYVKSVTREGLAAYTPGMPSYGARSRKEFLAFESAYRRKNDGMYMEQNETYNAWKSSLKK